MNSSNKIAICCTSGGYKNVFAQGVLMALEESNFRASAYAACSSSTLIAAYAAFGQITMLDLSLWEKGYEISQKEGNQSQAMIYSISQISDIIKKNLWTATSSRLLVATSMVVNQDVLPIINSDQAKRLGQRLLIDSLRHRTEWKEENLRLQMFDTEENSKSKLLTKINFDDVAYATTRMLHAWNIPAFIEDESYIDGSYTSLCPAPFLAQTLDFEKIICIGTEVSGITLDLFSDSIIPDKMYDTSIDFIKPDFDLKKIGVDYYSVLENGLEKAFEHGYEKGIEYKITNL